MNIEFKKDEQGNEVATISKADYEKAIAEATKNATAEAKAEGKKDAMQGIEDKYGITFAEIKNMQKYIKQDKIEKAKEVVKQEYLANGGKPEFFNQFYNSYKFEETKDLKEDMGKVKEEAPIFFNKTKPIQNIGFVDQMGIGTNDTNGQILNDGKGENLTQRLRHSNN